MKRLIGAASIALAVAGCGGSGENDGGLSVVRNPPATTTTTPTAPTTPVTPDPAVPAAPATNALGTGFYIGSTPANERLNVLVLDENVYYVFYSSPGTPDAPAGVVTGNYSSGSGKLTTNSNGKDFNLEGAGYSLAAADLNVSYVPSTSMSGWLTYRNGKTVPLSSNYSTDYNYIASASGLKGDYAGNAVTLDTSALRSNGVVVHIDATGKITTDAGTGCGFTGTATPRRQGKVYDVTITTGGAPCLYTYTVMSGIAYYDPTTTHSLPTPGQLYLFAMRPDRQVGMLFTGR